MRSLFILLLALVACVAQAQDLRQSVVVVRPNISDEVSSFYSDFADRLAKDGYAAAARSMRAARKGGFGSGFVVRLDGDDKLYVVTNRHVVGFAQAVNLDVHEAAGDVRTIKFCKVVAVDAIMDLALIELPASAKLLPLPLSLDPLSDADDVFTAGFPALGDEPSWQLGKGIVSNASMEMKDNSAMGIHHVVQHTAQVDPGSSGGPLLVRTTDDGQTVFTVVGVNTWKVSNRDNVNLAQGAKILSDFLDDFQKRGSQLSADAVVARAKELIDASERNFLQVMDFVSQKYMLSVSAREFYDVLLNISDAKCADVIIRSFRDAEPMDGICAGLGNVIEQHINARNYSFGSLENFSDASASASVKYVGRNDNCTISWVLEQGAWRVSNISSLNKHTIDKGKGIANSSNDFSVTAAASVGIPLSDCQDGLAYSFSAHWKGSSAFAWGFDLSRLDVKRRYEKEFFFGTHAETFRVYDIRTSYEVKLKAGAQVPIKANKFNIVPFAFAMPGVSFAEDLGGFAADAQAGCQLAYKVSYHTYIFVGAAYRYHWLFCEYDNLNSGRAEVMLGVTF